MRVFLIWGILILLVKIIYIVHKVIDYFKTINDPVSIYTVPIQAAPIQPPLLLNTMQYNPDVLNWKAGFASIFLGSILIFCYFIVLFKFTAMILFANVLLCFYIPLVCYCFNPKLRAFFLKCFKTN